jgi:hypothetical protein
MACADRLRHALLAVLAGGAVIAHAQVPAVRAPDPAASLMPPAATGAPAPRWSPAQVQQAFQRADSNADGQLTRAEAQQLAILPRSFEDLDANKDGILTLPEYQAGVQ